MQRRISSLDLFFFLSHVSFVLLSPASLANTSLKISRVVYVSELKTWTAARNYCRENYRDLVTFRNSWESSKLDMYVGWIGMFKELNDEWKWITDSDDLIKVQWCTLKNGSYFEMDKCTHNHPFLCIDDSLILAQELKTWEEALQYCRELHAVGRTPGNSMLMSDLASLLETDIIMLNTEETGLNTSTKEMWVGLRFLAYEWMWMSGEEVNSVHLPQCPAQDQHCGAIDPNNTKWEIMNCSERRNFICTIKQ
ncbi:uncharacterized protein LOC113174813 [Anabas testudineus]|uniref:C-type lectin domain-containing protein n=1 Tax=Anabas testudineus TaxID=64144 RepID=A0A7N6B5G7_ANATE|nr:uncharacterized protein LOC113174813 [Anabas testudineus]